ncbi:hypothetical protein [Anaeromyxobacter oryzae]|uniref:Uncharacterized protein n=1 Tax=Anaeromyxobacter oryzae TaxID=2918170 RepID=A0ABN6MVS6_9BACT|nr:hypothetical protein [Anaeromyxobacter oryzae]BDG03780.1 hypothetical protein AMOR_27760 [Anaeromyxobacter oryzae]
MDDRKPKVLNDDELRVAAGGARIFREPGLDVSGYKFAPIAGHKFAPIGGVDLPPVLYKFSPLV